MIYNLFYWELDEDEWKFKMVVFEGDTDRWAVSQARKMFKGRKVKNETLINMEVW